MQPIVGQFDAHNRRGGRMGKRDDRPPARPVQTTSARRDRSWRASKLLHASATNPGSSAISLRSQPARPVTLTRRLDGKREIALLPGRFVAEAWEQLGGAP